MVKKWHCPPGFAEQLVANLSVGAEASALERSMARESRKIRPPGIPRRGEWRRTSICGDQTYQQLDLRALRRSGGQISASFSSC